MELCGLCVDLVRRHSPLLCGVQALRREPDSSPLSLLSGLLWDESVAWIDIMEIQFGDLEA